MSRRQKDPLRSLGRIASPEMLPSPGLLPQLKRSRAVTSRGGWDEAGEHGDT